MPHVSRRTLLGAGLAAALPAPAVLAQANFTAPATVRLGYAPYISGGPFFIASAKGYFTKMNLTIEATSHVDGSLSMPRIAAGELDITGATISAGLFNLMAKGAPVRMFMEAGRETAGWGSNAILVSNKLWDQGFRGPDGYKAAKGEKIGISSRGSVAHYLHTIGLDRAGLKPDDVDWQWNMAPNVSLPLMNEGRLGIMNLPLPGAYAAQNKGIGKVATWSDELDPGMVLAGLVANERFLSERYTAAVRYCMCILQGMAEYVDAARSGNPEILKILAAATGLTPEVIDSTRPRWTWMNLEGLPDRAKIAEQQQFWHKRTDLLARTVPDDRLYDTRAAVEARQRLADKNPFL